jgi:hypothetical protein
VRCPTLQAASLRASIIAVWLLSLVTAVWAQTNAPKAAPALGRHFIVLIDDSCSIGGCKNGSTNRRQTIIADLPGRLFGETKELPSFNPDKDWLSVLFFTINQTARPCDPRAPKSALPENIFDLVFTGKLSGQKEFADKLQRWILDDDNDCHFKGNWSPIVISSLLVLPYMQSRLPAGALHSQTFLIQVTDGEFNSRTTPGHELTDYRRIGEINHVAEADQLLSKVAGLFNLKILPNQPAVRGVFYLAAEYSSQRVPESAVQFQRNSLLYPQALSSSELRYRLNDQLLGDIQLLSQGKGADYEFKPLWLRVGFQDAQGGDWRIGSQTLPRETTEPISLNPCQPPQCESSKDNDRFGIRLFDAAVGGPLTFSSSASDPGPGQIKFNIGFHYDTSIYNHLCVETPELLIKAEPAPPAEIPNLFLPSSRLGKSDVAGKWTDDEDRITTQEEAKNRILAERNLRILLLVFLLVIIVVLLMVFLFLRYYQRAFSPQLKWLPASKVLVDFNQSATSRILVGTLAVRNNEPVPWLGRLLKNDEQPTRHAEISLNYNYFEQSGLKLTGKDPIGFVRGEIEDGQEELDRKTFETVSDGREVYVFFAAEKIRDYHRRNGVNAVTETHAQQGANNQQSTNGNHSSEAVFNIPLTAQMEWQHTAGAGYASLFSRGGRQLKALIASERPGSVSGNLHCTLVIKPENARKPVVTYIPSAEPKLYFKKDGFVQVGSFLFKSQAEKEFAQPFLWQGYTIKSYQGNRPLSGEPIQLAQSAVEVEPKAGLEVPVFIYCDNETILNPDPVDCEYSFKLIGDYSPDSKPGPYFTKLHRDPTRAEIELRLISGKHRLEVYWTPTGVMKLRTVADGGDADELISVSDTILLDPQTIRFDVGNSSPRELVRFEVGNSGTAGRGVVELEIITNINCDPGARNSIQMEGDRPFDSLLGTYDFNTPRSTVTIEEGEPAEARTVRLQPNLISNIVSARIPSEQFKAEVKLAIRVVTDQGEESRRTLTFVIPIDLEQLPGRHWLAIDFGTSAISAALGAGRDENVMIVPLQTIAFGEGFNLAQYDIENSERDNDFLLPSWICCNADLRKASGDRNRPGFPGYYSEQLSMTPGEPDFIGLPAVTHEFEEYPGRIVYSLKSWLGKISRGIPILVKEDGKEVQKTLPLEEMVESGFAALAKGYLFDPEYHADQIVISHPNTFTRRHQDLLHKIAYRALGKPDRFRIPLRERIKLISESDAVAYHYCIEQMRGHPRSGTERILIYDFGAGTLDLSVIEVTWKQEPPRHPIGWQVKKRLGIPVAGNYIDEILARLIHYLLSDPTVVEANGFTYHFPIVGRPPLDRNDPLAHRRAIIRLWNWIRQGKHEWGRMCRKMLERGEDIADFPPLKVNVGMWGSMEVVTAKGKTSVNAEGLTNKPGLEMDEKGYINLSIPAPLILSDQRMTMFMNFVTEEIIAEVLDGAGINAENIDTVIVSGRGALFPDLREKVWRQFPNAECPDLLIDDTMKTAVVLGAIARQDLSQKFSDASAEDALTPELGVLINYDQDLVLERDWDKPIDLTASPTFRLVQVNQKNPNPRQDMKSLRKHFYIDLADHEFVRDDILGDDKHLYIHKEIRNGELAIYLEGKDGENRTPVFTEGQIAKIVTTLPWPVGNVLLDPHQ